MKDEDTEFQRDESHDVREKLCYFWAATFY